MARKKLQKFFALLLTFSMSMSLLSVGAFAAENDGGEKIQLSSVKLPNDSPVEIKVAFGTSEDDLESELPDYVLGTVKQEEEPPVEGLLSPEVPAVEGEGDVVQNPDGSGDAAQNPGDSGDAAQNPGDSGDAAQNPGDSGDAAQNPGDSGDAAQNPSDSGNAAQNPGDSGDAVQNPGDPGDSGDAAQNPGDSGDAAQNSDGSDDAAQNSGDSGNVGDAQQGSQENTLSATDAKMDPPPEDTEDTEEISVTWTCEAGYTGWIAGTYEFTAQLDSRYAYEGPLPTVTVTVANQADYVAEINGTQYETLQDAMDAAKEEGYNATITLLGNVLLSSEVQILIAPHTTLDLTLDLAGYEIAGDPDATSSNIIMRTQAGAAGTFTAKMTVKNGTFSGLHAKGTAGGGALSVFDSLTVENCVFQNNYSGAGGAIHLLGDGTTPSTTLMVKESTFIGNYDSTSGGGAITAANNETAVFQDVTFIDNASKSGGMGGALNLTRGTVEIDDCTFQGNTSATSGGAVAFSEADVTVKDSTFTGNRASSSWMGGAIHIQGPSMPTSSAPYTPGNLDISGCTFRSNSAGYGGAISAANNATLSLSDSTVSSNTADSSGGAVYTQGICTLNISTDLTSNEAGSNGGAIYSKQGTITMDGDLTDNSAGRNGGAICTFLSTVDVNGTVSGNSAAVGGGIYTGENAYGEAYDGKINLLDASVYNNTADEEGADIWQGSHNQMDLKEVGSDWVLEECGHDIDGWYYDEADARWSAEEKPLSAWEFTEFERNGIAMVNYSVALRAAHGLIPVDPEDPTLPDWEISKSKEATNLDDNYESQVTLSLPAADYKRSMDVVLVIDDTHAGSTIFEDAVSNLLSELAEKDTLDINVGVVAFDAVSRDWLSATTGGAYSGLVSIQDADALAALENAVSTQLNYDGTGYTKKVGGTNTEWAIDMASDMLSTGSGEDKYIVMFSDLYGYMYRGDLTIDGTTYSNVPVSKRIGTWNQGSLSMGTKYTTFADAYANRADGEMTPDGFFRDSSWDSYWSTYGSGSPENTIASAYQVESGTFSGFEKSLCLTYDNLAKAAGDAKVIVVNNSFPTGDAPAAQEMVQEMLDELEDSGYIKTYRYQTNSADKPLSGNAASMVFSGLREDLIQLVDSGSKVVDVIGYGTDNKGNEYDFDFVNDISTLTLTVNGEELPARELDVTDGFFTGSHETACYVFGDLRPMSLTSGYPFALHYYANGEDGQSDECFVWEINVAVTKDTPVELTYSVKLTNPQSADGTYGQFDADGSEHFDSLLTNLNATLYPVDSNGDQGMPEYFAKPTVSYTNTTPGGGGGGDDDDDDDDGGTNIPDENTPTTDVPGTDVPGTDIPDENTPTTDVPGTDLEDPDVPLADVPKTGDVSALWLALSALSGTGLAGVTFLGRKKRDEE